MNTLSFIRIGSQVTQLLDNLRFNKSVDHIAAYNATGADDVKIAVLRRDRANLEII